MPDLFWFILVFGVPGLVLGAIFGFVQPNWRLIAISIAVVAAIGLIATWPVIDDFRTGDDEDVAAGFFLMIVGANIAGWVVGLVTGAFLRRAERHALDRPTTRRRAP